jgi:hypothetical protein
MDARERNLWHGLYVYDALTDAGRIGWCEPDRRPASQLKEVSGHEGVVQH